MGLPGRTDIALAGLEARNVARRVGRVAGPTLRTLDTAMARGENLLTKWWLGHLIRRVASMPDDAGGLEWLARLRARAAGGSWSYMPDRRGVLSMIEHALPPSQNRVYSLETPDTAFAAPREDQAVLYYVPGGGFMLPVTPRQREIARQLAAEFGAAAICGQHRLAPEHQYPLPVEDLRAQYLALIEAGLPGSQIIVGGDSAGATLLLSMLLSLRDRKEPMPAGALLFSPWTDLAMRGWSYVTKGVSGDSPFRMETAAFAARLYLGETLPTEPGASPAYADLRGFPPIAVHCSRYDMHFDDAVRLAEQAEAAGVPIRVNYWESPRHHLERFRSRDARESMRIAGEIARGWLGTN